MKNRTINVKGSEITVSRKEQEDYISLTDIARDKNPAEPIDVIKNWMRNRSTIEFINKDCQFISFNIATLGYLFQYYEGEELKSIFNKLSNQIYQPHSEFKTFFYVYLGFIKKHLKSDTIHEPLKYLIEKTIIDAKKLTSRTLSFIEFPSLNKNEYPMDMKMVNESCFAYIYELYRLVKSSDISDQLKAEYVAIIRKNANLAYWYESTYKNAPVIKLLY